MSPAVHVYCGPTITAGQVLRILPAAVPHPPARHGDLLRIELGPGDIVVIIDGAFHLAAPVRHKEILQLLAEGVRVVGAASMGALRAAELHQYGMTGIGRIFEAYRDGIITSDDEVAVTHTPDGYAPLSHALVDIRYTLDTAAAAGVISEREGRRLAAHAAAIYYPARTWQALAAAADADLQPALDRLGQWRARAGNPGSLKARDARESLDLIAAGALPATQAADWASGQWQNMFVRDWLARFRGVRAGGVHVPLEMMLRHQQIHDPDWPRRWRRHVLSWMAGTEASAAGAAEAAGIAPRHMDSRQRAYWLTAAEAAGLDEREQLARILVRAVARDLTAPLWPASEAEAAALINPGIDSAAAASAALRCSEAIAARAPGRTIWHLRKELVSQYLAGLWGTSPDGEDLTAAARDRGFISAGTAIDAARIFYLFSEADAAVSP